MILPEQYIRHIQLKRDKVPSFDRYPFALPAIRPLDVLEIHKHVTFFVGDNGSGKSTLLEAVAVAMGFNPEGGTRNFNFNTRNSHSELHEYLFVLKGLKRAKDGFFLRAESFFNVATEIDILDKVPFSPPLLPSYGGISLHEQSHGESFMALMMNRFGGNGLYILDEPEAAVSPQRQLAMLSLMHRLVKQKSQFVIATHSPILLAYPDAWIYQFTPKGIERIAYEETEHYRVTRDFLVSPERMLRELLGDG